MSIANLLISPWSACQIYTLGSVFHLHPFALIYSKTHMTIQDKTGCLKGKKCWPTANSVMLGGREEREKEREREVSCYEMPLWCFNTTRDEKSGLFSPVFYRSIDGKGSIFEISANLTKDKSVIFDFFYNTKQMQNAFLPHLIFFYPWKTTHTLPSYPTPPGPLSEGNLQYILGKVLCKTTDVPKLSIFVRTAESQIFRYKYLR